MFSGKTTELIHRLKKAQASGCSLRIFKPFVDDRYALDHIVSHDGARLPAESVNASAELLKPQMKADVIGIDEAQFFDENLPKVCNSLADEGVRVLIAGLDMDFMGRPFGPMPFLLAIAEYVTKLHTFCARTGAVAHYTHRRSFDNKQVLIGGEDQYEPLSRAIFSKERKRNFLAAENIDNTGCTP